MTAILSTDRLSVGYTVKRRPSKVVGQDLSLELKKGELVCLLGPNGAGKSTLIRTLAGIQPPLQGTVLLENRDIRRLPPGELARIVAVVLTEKVMVGHLSVYQLVGLGRTPYTNSWGTLKQKDRDIVQWALESTDTWHLRHRDVDELSDGERQKVMIARALAQEPKLLILDEPTAFLDLSHRLEMLRLLRNLAREGGISILLSTHDLEIALKTADCFWLMPADGLLRMGAPEDLVLSGAFETTFVKEGIEFDRQTGSFKLQQAEAPEIGLSGGGMAGFWTAQALKREGLQVVDGSGDLPWHVRVSGEEGRIQWVLSNRGESHEFGSIYELAGAIRRIAPKMPATGSE
ncbi:MAG: ABC transporter ATP-binding protein [Proteobacteria bacterium]|nr:ABC transporter ATP-binding protein [Pseudomonadota bacterium]